MDAIEILTKQHREMEKRLGAVEKAAGASARSLFEQAADELAAHVAVEERVFYPAVKAQRTEDVLLESLEEHLSLKRLLADLLRLDAEDKAFEPKLKVLKEQVEHHHKEEEEHLFPKVRKMFDDERRAALGAAMEAERARIDAGGAPRSMVLGQTGEAAPLA